MIRNIDHPQVNFRPARTFPSQQNTYMKLTTLAALILLCSMPGISQAKAHRPVSVLAVRNDLFYFKVDKAFIGATVEVYSSSGELVLSQKVMRHKTLIDFFDKKEDKYTIKIKTGCSEFDYLYTKFDPAGTDIYKPEVAQL